MSLCSLVQGPGKGLGPYDAIRWALVIGKAVDVWSGAAQLAGEQAREYVHSLLEAQLGAGPVRAALTAPADAAAASALDAVRGCAAKLLAPGAWLGFAVLHDIGDSTCTVRRCFVCGRLSPCARCCTQWDSLSDIAVKH